MSYMAEDFSDEPVGYALVKDFSPLSIPHKFVAHQSEVVDPTTSEILSKDLFNNFSRDVNRFIVDTKVNYSQEEQQSLELMFDAVFAPFRLNELKQELEGDFARYKTVSARSQQALSHYLVYALNPESDPKYQSNMREIVMMYEALSAISPKVSRYWHGALAQTRGIVALNALGLPCLGPQVEDDPMAYSDDGSLVPLKGNEVYDWDVKRGIDAVTGFQGHAYLVNFKSSNDSKIVLEHQRSEDSDVFKKDVLASYPVSLKRSLVSLGSPGNHPRVLQRVEMHVPVGRSAYDAPNFDKVITGSEAQLRSFLLLKEQQRRSLLGQLMRVREKYYDVV